MAEAKQNLQGSDIIAKLFGVTERRVQQLAKEGVIPAVKTRPYQFDLLPTVRAYIKHLSDKANGREEKKDGDTELKRMKAEADLKRSKADIAELQLQELRGEMHRSEDVEAVMTDLVYTIRSMLISMPGRLAVDVASVNSAAEASEVIRVEVCKVLEELSGYKYDPDVYARRVREREGWREIAEDNADE